MFTKKTYLCTDKSANGNPKISFSLDIVTEKHGMFNMPVTFVSGSKREKSLSFAVGDKVTITDLKLHETATDAVINDIQAENAKLQKELADAKALLESLKKKA